MTRPKPLKGKRLEALPNASYRPVHYDKDIHSAVENLKELEILINDAIMGKHITHFEWKYWEETLKYEEAFEDVIRE